MCPQSLMWVEELDHDEIVALPDTANIKLNTVALRKGRQREDFACGLMPFGLAEYSAINIRKTRNVAGSVV